MPVYQRITTGRSPISDQVYYAWQLTCSCGARWLPTPKKEFAKRRFDSHLAEQRQAQTTQPAA